MKHFPPTPEQAKGIGISVAMKPGELIQFNAYAGSGKTTTLRFIGEAVRPLEWKTLYICYNAAMASDARTSLPAHIESRTAHSLAFGQTMRRFPSWRTRLGNLRARDLQTAFNIGDPLIAQAVCESFNYFLCLPLDSSVCPNPIDAFTTGLVADAGWGFMEAADQQAVIRGCVATYNAIFENKGPAITVPHDAYLWYFIYSKPVLPFDLILVDEAQDLNPLMLRLIELQLAAGKRVVIVGDTHQSIYGFRRATNALEKTSEQAAHRLTLTECFRFPQPIADAAGKLLKGYKGDAVRLLGRGTGKTKGRPTRCYLARTNACLVQHAATLIRSGRKLHFASTSERDGFNPTIPYKFAEIRDVYALWSGRSSEVRTPWLRQFPSYGSLLDYANPTDSTGEGEGEAKAGGDAELRSMVKLIDTYQGHIPTILRGIEGAATDAASADWCLSSAHRAKGREWDHVQMADDFLPLDQPEKIKELRLKTTKREFAEAVNLLYVGITRTKGSIEYPGNSSGYFATNAASAN